jgi:hypothetical protein
VADGWSLGILSRELSLLQRSPGGPVSEAAGPGAADYAIRQRAALEGGELVVSWISGVRS